MRLKHSFESIEMGDEIVAVAVGTGAENVHGVLKMNKAGQEIIEMLGNEITENQIVDKLAQKYDNDRELLETYVHEVVEYLQKADLII